jgi:probable phosphomutase (TIGR03848 family)
MAIILLIRHGVNDFVGKRLAGRLPGVHLNEKGQQQAQSIAEALKDAPLKAIYSSPLDRTMETAAPLAAALDLKVNPNPGLLEVDFGDWQGKTMGQIRRSRKWKTVQENPAEMRFPNGESFPEAQERIATALKGIAAAHDENEMVACFSHSDSIKLAVAYFLDMPMNAFQRIGVDTASITGIFISKEGKPFLINVNQRLSLEWPKEKKPKRTRKKAKEQVIES